MIEGFLKTEEDLILVKQTRPITPIIQKHFGFICSRCGCEGDRMLKNISYPFVCKHCSYSDVNKAKTEKIRAVKTLKYGDPNYNNSEKQANTMIAKHGGVGYAAADVRTKMWKNRTIEKDGILFNSKAEVAFYDFLIKEHIPFVAHPTEFLTYEYAGKTHRYFPDFIVNGKYVEIKGEHLLDEHGNLINPWDRKNDDILKAKQKCMTDNDVIIIIARNDYSKDGLTKLF